MIIPDQEDRYLSKWKLVETAVYIESLNKVVRQKEDGKAKIISIYDLDSFRSKYNNIGLYTSIWHYDTPDLDAAIRCGSLYFDIDNVDESISLEECRRLYLYLKKSIPEESIVVYFTGKKGFHIECEAIALGINPSNALPKIFRYIATKIKESLNLSSLDFAVYDMRRMWRLAGSKHQDTGLYKNRISEDLLFSSLNNIKEYCAVEQNNIVSPQSFNAKANEWFRQFNYDMEIDKERSKDFLAYFNKHGSSAFKDVVPTQAIFTPDVLMKNCTAVKRLKQEAEKNNHLDHEARLFLCSILTYNEESIKFLHEILSKCSDYNFEKSSSHINDWIKRRQMGIGGRPYTCERANAVGVGCGQCQLEKKNKWIKIGEKFIESTEVSEPSPVRFAYKSIKKEENE
jgi:hypothetical protein